MAAGRASTSTGGLVYSTEGGRMCPSCRRPLPECVCRATAPAARGDGIVRVGRQTSGRGGKVVTVIRGVDADAEGLATLGRQLRMLCGSGGTVNDGVIEVQGDQCERVIEHLQRSGWKVKRAGG